MRANQSERFRRNKEFEVNHNRLRAHQIETMIAEFHRMCVDLGQQIEAEEKRTRIADPMHFAYSTYAKAVRERRARAQQSVDALRIELERLMFETNKSPEQDFAA